MVNMMNVYEDVCEDVYEPVCLICLYCKTGLLAPIDLVTT